VCGAGTEGSGEPLPGVCPSAGRAGDYGDCKLVFTSLCPVGLIGVSRRELEALCFGSVEPFRLC
jgi:hypothetical protein